MREIVLLLPILAGLACLPCAPAAQAQPARVFVAAQGLDSNPCTFALPCRTFQHAHDVVAAGGEIDVLDPAGYGIITITKAISIQGHGFAGIAVPTDVGITVSGGASDKINLSGLLIDGVGGGGTGIRIQFGASVNIQDCLIRSFSGSGIDVLPAGTSKVSVSDTVLADNGNGIYFLGSGTVAAVLDHVVVENSNGSFGIGANGNSGATFDVTINASVIAGGGNVTGISAFSALGPVHVMVQDSVVANTSVGVSALSAQATVRIGRSTITGNATGISAGIGGIIDSYGDNNIDGNNADGAPTATIPRH